MKIRLSLCCLLAALVLVLVLPACSNLGSPDAGELAVREHASAHASPAGMMATQQANNSFWGR